MLLNNRHGSVDSDSYRYGFQGQERDDEVKGEGNSYNYKYRMHDPRLGRFFAVDPLAPEYPHYTPYQFSGNKVIHMVELEGLEEQKFNSMIDMNTAIKLSGENATTKEILETYQQIHNRDTREFNSLLFKLPFIGNDDAINLINHYSFSMGEDYRLNKSEMLHMFPRRDDNVQLSGLDFYKIGDLKEGEEVPFERPYKAYSGTDGTLGNTTITLKGIIRINPDSKKREFVGEAIFDDTYDFNEGDRGFKGEAQVWTARNFLMGTPFRMYGSLQVSQQEDENLVTNDSLYPADPTDPNNKPLGIGNGM